MRKMCEVCGNVEAEMGSSESLSCPVVPGLGAGKVFNEFTLTAHRQCLKSLERSRLPYIGGSYRARRRRDDLERVVNLPSVHTP